MGNREAEMVVVSRKMDGTPDVFCDPEIAGLVAALNRGGARTVASCSGHGFRPGNIVLADGRELIVAAGFDEARNIEAAMLPIFPLDINGAPVEPALPLPNYEAAKRAARAARPGDTLYPRLFVRDGGWMLQRTPGTSPVPVSNTEALALTPRGEVA